MVNENDVVSVTELMFTDNDELAGLIASMLNAQALIVLTNVDGIYNGDPKAEGSAVIEEVAGSVVDFCRICIIRQIPVWAWRHDHQINHVAKKRLNWASRYTLQMAHVIIF